MAGTPGIVFSRSAQSVVPGRSTDTGQAFFAGIADQGPAEAVRITGMDGFDTRFGDRIAAYPALHDAAEAFFRNGGAVLHVSRVLGPAAAEADVDLLDGSAAVSLTVRAVDAGAYGNSLRITVVNPGAGGAGTFDLIVEDSGGTELERHENLADPAAAVSALSSSDRVRATAGPGGDPVAVTDAALTGGTDDRAAITQTQWDAALDRFAADLGPGQVAAPGHTTSHTALLAHAADRNRTALLDVAQGASKAALTTAANAVRNLDDAKHGAIFATWATLGPVAAGGANRPVPASGYVAGLIARSDAAFDAGRWPIADNGVIAGAVGLESTFSDDDRTDLYDLGVNVAVDNPPRLYGFRATTSDADWRNLGHQRLAMAIQADVSDVQERFIGRFLIPEVIGDFKSVVEAKVHPYWTAGALDGTDPEGLNRPASAYLVDVGPSINTDATKAARELHARVYARFSESAERVLVALVKIPVGSSLPSVA